jgi:lipid II:glycine glycyltransferase (peptidoglycan interpeptide bridge formation enzyme)
MALYPPHYETMCRAKAMGYEWYDLWGVAPANEHDHPWQGVSVFKRRFGGMELNLVPTFDYVYDSAA